MMHYYKRNLGDYAKKAGRLSMLQHGSYTLLIDACYDREQFPTMDEAIEWTWASTTEEIEAVQFVLRKFFILEDGVYVQTRIREELEEYRQKAEVNKRIATEREANRKAKSTNRIPVVNEPTPNQEPVTSNHKPEEKKKNKRFVPPTVEEVREYCQSRKNCIDPVRFVSHYQSKGWKVGNSPMIDWKAAIITWEGRDKQSGGFSGDQKPERVRTC